MPPPPPPPPTPLSPPPHPPTSPFRLHTERMSLYKYFNVDKEQVEVVLGDKICDQKGFLNGKEIYLPYDTVKSVLNSRFYWDRNENLLLYTTPNAVIQASAGSKDCYTNNSKTTKEYEIVILKDDTVYIALDYIKEHTALNYKNVQEATACRRDI